MTAPDLSTYLVIVLAAACTCLAIYAWQEHRRANTADAASLTFCRAAQRLARQRANHRRRAIRLAHINLHLRQRNAVLQEQHSLRVRQLLSRNYYLIAANVAWRRKTDR